MKYARWAAVSTVKQAAADKVSINVQLDKGAEAAKAYGWAEAPGSPYVVPGKSRTKWVSLYHAERSVPQLRAMLEAASLGAFDVLYVYDLNRFRDLMRQVFDVLCDYNVQVYVGAYPREPVPPDKYDDNLKAAAGMIVDLSGMISRNEINTLRRHYRDKMPARITTKGLHAGLGLPPYAYHKPPGDEYNPNAVLVPQPQQVRTLYQMKDWLLAGVSLKAIAQRLNDAGIPSPRGRRWWYSVVSYVLSNPFYYGVVSFGATRTQRDRRNGQVLRKRATPQQAVGKHQPVWDEQTHRRIVDEIASRKQAFTGHVGRQLSRLLRCGVCGATMWAQVTPKGKYWRCSQLVPGHASIRDDDALKKVAAAMVHDLQHLSELPLPKAVDKRPQLEHEIADFTARRRRWLDLYESGSLAPPELSERVADLDAKIRRAAQELAAHKAGTAAHNATMDELQVLANGVAALPTFIIMGEPANVNARLRAVLQGIRVDTNKSITLLWR